MKIDRKYTPKQEREAEDKLFEAIKTLQGFEEYRSFFQDILTPSEFQACLLYTSPSPRDRQKSRMPSSA